MGPFAPNKSLRDYMGQAYPERSEVRLFACYKKATGFARGKPVACLKSELPFGLALTLSY